MSQIGKYIRGLPFTARFWNKVDRKGPDECWEWTAYKREKGYGRVYVGGKLKHAHAVALSLTDGVWDSPLQTLHKCDNPPCCNPTHLWRGTNQENNQDMWRKGRGIPHDFSHINGPGRNRGTKNGRNKLTPEQVLAIHAQPERGATDLGAEFGVSYGTVHGIRRRKIWKWL